MDKRRFRFTGRSCEGATVGEGRVETSSKSSYIEAAGDGRLAPPDWSKGVDI